MPPVIYTGHITGDTLPAADWNGNWQLVESGALDLGGCVIAGLVPTIGTGLSVNVSAGTALIGAHIAPAAFSIVGLADNTTNHLYLLQSGAGASNTTGTPPAASAKLGTCVTLTGVVTSVNTNRSSGRQLWVTPQSLVPGGPGAGNPPSISLPGWAAAAADGVPVFGTLPPLALGGGFPALLARLGASAANDPTLPAFSWINQAGATAVNGVQSVFLSAPATGGHSVRLRVIAVPATPYTITIGFLPSFPVGDFLSCGLAFYDSVSTKVSTLCLIGNSATDAGQQTLAANKYANPTTYATDYAMLTADVKASAWMAGACMWLRLTDDGVNKAGWVSNDPTNFAKIWTTTHADYFVPTHVGVFVNPFHATYGAGVNLLSWQVS